MTLSKIDPRYRSTLRLHGWLLILWASAVGFLTSTLLLHVFMVRSMGVRYAVGAASVYFIGFVIGGKWYANWWNEKRHSVAGLPRHASPEDQVQYDQKEMAIRKKFEKFDWLGDISGLGDDPLSALIAIIWLVGVAFFVLLLLGYLPYFATDLIAGYMAEIVLEFVIGGLLMRRVLKPRAMDDYWGFIVGKTWLAGVLMIVVFGSVGFLIQNAYPDMKTIFQLLH